MYSAGASWAGGVVPVLGADNGQVVAGDTITIDATFGIGDDTVVPALDVLNGGTLDWDNLGNDTCDFQGDLIIRAGGTLTLNGAAAGGNKLIIQLNRSGVLAAGKYGLIIEDNAIIDCDGFNKTFSWTTLSADAAAGQKDVVTTDDVSGDWNIGDEFVVGSMSTPTKTGAETDTIGGIVGTTLTKAGANYAFAHEENVAIINLTHNIVFTSFNIGFKGYVFITNNTPGNVVFDWCEFSYFGLFGVNKYGVSITRFDFAEFNYCSFHRCYRALSGRVTGAHYPTLDNCVFGLNVTADTYYVGVNASVTDCACLGSDGSAFTVHNNGAISGSHFGNADGAGVDGRVDCAVSDCRYYGNNTGHAQTVDGIVTLTDCSFDGHSNRAVAVGNAICRLTDTTFGAQVANVTDIYSTTIVIGTGINTIALTVTVAGVADNRVSIEDTANNHKTWKATGSFEKQAVVVRTGTYATLMSPTSAALPLIAESTVPARNGVQIVVSCYFRKNPAYGAANLPFIRLSGKGMVTDTDAIANIDDTWLLVTVAGTPTSDGFAKVEFVVQSAGGGAAAYFDDVLMVYTAIDTGSQDYWYEGNVPPVLMSTGLGALDVFFVQIMDADWAAGTFGRLLRNLLNIARFFQATKA